MTSEELPARALYERGAARVFEPGGEVAGAGFLIGERLVCTCVHVVCEPDGSRPTRPVTVDFPLLGGVDPGTAVAAEVEEWRPEDDIAVLRLAGPVPGTLPLPLADGTGEEWGGEIRAFGFPEGAPRGVNATGVLRGRQRADRLQLDLAAHGVPIGPGFSGSAVWDVRRHAVVGMLVTRGRRGVSGTAYLIPAERLLGADARLPCPFRSLERFEEGDARYFHGREEELRLLGRALAERPVTVVTAPSGSGKSSLLRAGLLAELRRRGAPSVLRVPQPGADADAWVAEAVAAAWHAAAPDGSARAERAAAVRTACAGADGERLALRGLLRDELGARGAVLLLDQFEEYAVASPHGALRAFRVLSALAAAPDPAQGGGLRVVLTARPATLEALTAADTTAPLARAVAFLAPMTAEALTRAVEEPVRAVPGLRLQAGLAARVVRDAVDEPGCLPLLQFTLTQLWQRRKAHTLTHAAYEEIGLVGGALGAYAEETLDACLRETGVPPDTARRLFQRLARPDGGGGFVRSAVATAELPVEQQELARALARERLLVWDVGTGAESGPGTVTGPGTSGGTDRVTGPGTSGGTTQVVHEALLREWTRLAAWLSDGAEFRAWQERTAQDAAEWEAAGRPAGMLPHGVRLAQGLEWLRTRPQDLTTGERAYLAAGARWQRRGLRRLRGVVGLITALALLVTGGAVKLYLDGREADRQLRTAASVELAELAVETGGRSPDSALRYAAAAWSADRTPEARQALFEQYVRAHDTTASYSGLWRGAAQRTAATPDGRTLVVVSLPDGSASVEASVVTGALGGTPRGVRLKGFPGGRRVDDVRHAVSDDGRRYAVTMPDGDVLLWDLTHPGRAPRRLSGPLSGLGDVYHPQLDFSDDGGELLHAFGFVTPRPQDDGRQGLLRLWRTDTGRSLPVSQRPVTSYGPVAAWLLGDGDQVAVAVSRKVRGGQDPRYDAYLTVHTTATGALVRQVYGAVPESTPTPVDRGRGVLLGGAGGRRWYAVTPGADGPRAGAFHGAPLFHDLTGTHLTDVSTTESERGGGHGRVTLLDVRDGTRYRTATLPGRPDAAELVVTGGGDGPRTVLAAVGDSLLYARALPAPAPDREAAPGPTTFALAPDGAGVARLHRNRLEVRIRGRAVHSTRALKAGTAEDTDLELGLLWVTRKGADALLLWSRTMPDAMLYNADTFARTPVTWDCGRGDGTVWNRPQDVAQTAGGSLAVLCVGDSLVRVDPRTGLQNGGPIRLERTPREPAQFSVPGRLTPRPGHRDQVAVVTDDWRDRGRIEVWDLRRGTQTARLGNAPLTNGDDPAERWVAFSPDGERLAALGALGDRRVTWWRVDDEARDGQTRPLTDATGLLGVAADGTLVAAAVDDVRLFAPATGKPLGLLEFPGYTTLRAAEVAGTALRLASEEVALTLSLSPSVWHRTLCAAARGPYSPAQRALPRLDAAKRTTPCGGA
ncbi:serine protease [Streptomyces sp. NPDC051940]|uniref:serine protease n=1 Tax=Streptomyces sp. NPDC051940 TaxID=3155675 RepID=UPI00342B715B